MPKIQNTYCDERPKADVMASLKLACAANNFEVVEAGDELLAKNSMGLTSWPITLSFKVKEKDGGAKTSIDLTGEIGGVGPIQASHLRKNIEKVIARAGISDSKEDKSASSEADPDKQSGDTNPLQTPLSEKPIGFVLAALGGLPAAPVGIAASVATLFLLSKKLHKGTNNSSPNRFLWWAAIGIIGLPISFGINSAIFPGIYNADTSSTPTTKTPESNTTIPEAPAPIEVAWDSEQNKKELEQSLTENWANALTGVQQAVKSADCSPTSSKGFWNCSVRLLGEEQPQAYKVEVDEKTGKWAAQPIF